MARVTGPLMSLSASGSVANTITFASWKGRDYAREYFIPANPQTAKQVNIRTALTLLIPVWQAVSAPGKTVWDEFAKTFRMSGFNQFMSRGMKAYIDQLTVDVTPVSVSVVGAPPDDVWTWA